MAFGQMLYQSASVRKFLTRLIGVRYPAAVRVEAFVALDDCILFGPLEIGFRTYANASMIRANTVIGRYCSIGRWSSIAAARHDVNRVTTHPISQDPALGLIDAGTAAAPQQGARIGSDVWIGDNVVILDGVAIGHGAVVGAGSVVTKDISPYTIVAGVPARVIRQRFPSEIVEQLLALEWWAYGDVILKGLDFRDLNASVAMMRARAQTLEKIAPHFEQA